MSKRNFRSALCPLFGLLLLATGCAHIPPYVDVQLPAYASAIFVECSSTNGALSFQVNRQGNTLEAADLEWAAKPNGDWGLASYSPFGQTLFQLQFNKKMQSYEATGRKGAWLDDVTIKSDGFLSYRGQRLGLKPDEFPCFFAGHLPRAWLRQVTSYTTDSEGLLLQVQEKERFTTVRIARHGSAGNWHWQSKSSWDVYWGLRRESVQLENRKDSSMVLTAAALEDVECRWAPKEED